MLQAMNTGHDGSLTTIHANTPHDAISRIESMVAMSGLDIPRRAVQAQIGAAIDVIIQLSRLADGTRKALSIVEVIGTNEGTVEMIEVFRFDRRGVDEEGNVLGDFVATGKRPQFLEKLRLAGVDYPRHLFGAANEAKRVER